MAQLNIGTLFIDTARPLDNENYSFPIVLSNEIRGGIHIVTSSTNFPEILTPRRQWGMMVYVLDESKTYQLRPISDNNLGTNGNNWVPVNFGDNLIETQQWQNSVIDVVTDATSIISPSNGSRYLVGNTPSGGEFGNKKNQIATWNSGLNNGTGGWQYSEPENGTTLRVDSYPNQYYVFVGTMSQTGSWFREYQNVVRYIEPQSNNGRTFSFTNTLQTKLTGYTNSVYYCNFATSNSGTVSLSIDNNPYKPVYKSVGGVLSDLVAGDFKENIPYQLVWSGDSFVIDLPASGQNVIGPAEVGDYTDGLYTDFTTSTPVGTAVDRFNLLLKSLAPPSAPNLNEIFVTNQSQFVTGKISYQYSDQPGLGYVSTTFSDIDSGVTLGGTYSKNSPELRRLGIRKRDGEDIIGVLNNSVDVHPSLPIPAYAEKSFGNGITGSVVLYLNGVTISNINLGSTISSIDTTLGGSFSGMNLSAATSSKFSEGAPFENFWYRTGSFLIKNNDINMVNGFNYIQVNHFLPLQTLTLSRVEFINDASTLQTTFNSPFGSLYTTANKKWLSGIEYYTEGLSFQHNQLANNIYSHTYYPGEDAGEFTDESDIQISNIFNNGNTKNTNTPNIASFSVAFTPNITSFQSLPVPTNVNSNFTFTKVFNVNSGIRRINGSVKTFVQAKRTVQPTVKSSQFLQTGWFIDTFSQSSTNLIENFDDESKRLTIGNWATVSSTIFTNGNFNSQASIRTTNDLQIGDGRLFYPDFNYTTVGNNNTNPNFGGGANRNYSNVKTINAGIRGLGSRTYLRAFYLGNTPPIAKFKINIEFDSTLFIPVTNLTGVNNQHVTLEFKLPYNQTAIFLDGGTTVNGAATGWLDACNPQLFTGDYSDGAGCLGNSQYDVVKSTSNADWIIDFGQRNTILSDGWVIMRITTGSEWIGCIEKVTITPS